MNLPTLSGIQHPTRPKTYEFDRNKGVYNRVEDEEKEDLINKVIPFFSRVESILDEFDKVICNKYAPKWYRGLYKTYKRQFINRNPTYGIWMNKVSFDLTSSGKRIITDLNT